MEAISCLSFSVGFDGASARHARNAISPAEAASKTIGLSDLEKLAESWPPRARNLSFVHAANLSVTDGRRFAYAQDDMRLERVDQWCERGILGFVLAILIYGPLALGAVRPLDQVVLQILTGSVLLLWLLRFWVGSSHRLLWPPICWPVVLFVGYAIVRYQQAEIEYVARQELIKILIYAFLFFAILNNLHSQETVRLITLVLVFLGMAISLYALYQFLSRSERVWNVLKPEMYAHRASGTYINPNHLGGFLEMILPLGLAFTLTGRFSHAAKILLGYASLAIFIGIGVTISRGAWLATGAALLFFFGLMLFRREYRLMSLVVLVLLVLSGSFFVTKSFYVKQRFGDMKGYVPGTFEEIRYRLWRPAIKVWQENPWWGGGPAHFDYRFRAFRPEPVQARPGWAHNDYLNTLADWGVAGTAIVASAWLLLYVGVLRGWKFVRRANDLASQNSNRSAFVFGAAVGLLAILVHSVVEFNMHIPANAILAVSLMALVAGHLRFATERYWVTPGWIGKFLASVVALLGLVYLGEQTRRGAAETYWLRKAENTHAETAERLAFLQKAHAAEPMNADTVFKMGENLQLRSGQVVVGYRKMTEEALKWFQQAARLNPLDPFALTGCGKCLHDLDRPVEATRYFERAIKLDPNGSRVVGQYGEHLFILEQYAEAAKWFQRSWLLHYPDNPLVKVYWPIVTQKLEEQAKRPKP